MKKLKKFFMELPTIFKLKKQIKKLKTENKVQLEVIDDLEEHIKDISDLEVQNQKIKRLEASRDHWLKIVHKLRNENKELKQENEKLVKELEEAQKCYMK